MENLILKCLNLNSTQKIPVWFMRQAGRYLPEFRQIRLKNKNFIKLCLDAELSSEITMQPIKRFQLDAAIIFSDILMVPYALGQQVKFQEKKGPILSEFNLKNFLSNNRASFTKKLFPVYKSIEKVKKKLNKKQSLISFVGAPWTLIIYMLNLKKDKNSIDKKKLTNLKLDMNLILERLNSFLLLHIENQINAGADVVQIFDSWAGLLDEQDLQNFCYIPNKKITNFCKNMSIPTICFPKGIGKNYAKFCKI